MKRESFRHLERLRVRWAEVDAQQVVFNGHYLLYVDVAVAGWWRALALPYPAAVLAMGGDLYVRKATLEYEVAARHDERLAVGIRCARIGRSSMQFQAAVFRDNERLVQAELVYVFADPASMRSQPVPTPLRAVVEAFEAGEPMLQVVTGDWAEQGAAVQSVRAATAGDDDPTALHAVATNRVGVPISCARLQLEGGSARIDRRHTLAALRGAGYGRAVLDALLGAARDRGCETAEVDGVPVSLQTALLPRMLPRGAGPGTKLTTR
ncbi:MAG: YbgC/FadM family acyl-CoA thioesterase [Pseudomonadota bacterium]|nr:YbgC/FadM family acyl-CoA thioesterase [Pseudomonadota bacterium]